MRPDSPFWPRQRPAMYPLEVVFWRGRLIADCGQRAIRQPGAP